MKKFLCLILVLILSMSVFAACGNNEENPKNENDVVLQNETNNETEVINEESKESDLTINEDTPKKETNSPKDKVKKIEIKEDSKNNQTQDFYLILNGTNEENITYHTQKCPLLKDKEIQKTSWEMITMLQFRHCAKCNPPKYEGYVE